MQLLGQPGHLAEDAIELEREQLAERQREESSDADQERRLPQQHGGHAPPADPDRAQRRNLAEPLVHRHGEQRRHEQKREHHRERRKDQRDLAEVREAVAIELLDHLVVGVHRQAGARALNRRDGGGGARVRTRRGENQIRVARAIFARRAMERLQRRRDAVVAGAAEREPADAGDAARDRRHRGPHARRLRVDAHLVARRDAERGGERPADDHRARLAGGAIEIDAADDRPDAGGGAADADERHRRRGRAAARGNPRRQDAHERDLLDFRQPAHQAGNRGRIGNRHPQRHAAAADDADVVPGALEEIRERKEQPAGEEEHVEEERADDGDARDGEERLRAVAADRPPREVQRAHRRTIDRTSRRSSVHEAAMPAAMPSGAAIRTERAAIDGVTRTNTSAVS